MPVSKLGLTVLLGGLAGCAPAVQAKPDSRAPVQRPSADSLLQAEQALQQDQAAFAVAMFGRFLAGNPEPRARSQALLGLARAQEKLRDCGAAILAYESFLASDPVAADRPQAFARKGACEAELERWEASAQSFRSARELGELLPSARIESLAREGYALFQLDRFEEADKALAEADAVFEQAERDQSERFATYYFVGMARFYRAAILHRRFRELPIRLPESVMAQDFAKKLELLVAAQEAYNHTIRAKHMFWVSAAGFQLGQMFGEFYDALMYAPVPTWLDGKQKKIYYEELKKQLTPIIEKGIWVFRKNLETARRLGYESEFVQLSQAKLAHLQAIMLGGEAGLGQPNPRLVPELLHEQRPAPDSDQLAPADKYLFVPEPTPL